MAKVNRPRRSPARPTVAMPQGPLLRDIELLEKWHPDAMTTVREAADLVLRDRVALKNGGMRMYHTADDVVTGFIDTMELTPVKYWIAWKTMLNVIKEIVVSDPRYYGIVDPITQKSCVQCRLPHPVESFEPGSMRCKSCEEKNANL